VPPLDQLLADLSAEGDALDGMLALERGAVWQRETPAVGWTIAHQIGHLAWTDEVALLAATEPPAFTNVVATATAELNQPGGLNTFVDLAAERGAAGDRHVTLARWRSGRRALIDALRAVPDGTKVPWFGPPMSVASMATARIMETWAHGQDIADALGVHREPTGRLRHVAHLGVRTRDFSFAINGKTPPTEEFRIELTGPDSAPWCWGPDAAAQRVTGPALDFCLLVTQRRNRANLAMTATGSDAGAWLDIAQAFAGPPGKGRSA